MPTGEVQAFPRQTFCHFESSTADESKLENVVHGKERQDVEQGFEWQFHEVEASRIVLSRGPLVHGDDHAVS